MRDRCMTRFLQRKEVSLLSNLTAYAGAVYDNELAYRAWYAYPDLKAEDIEAEATRFNVLVREIARVVLKCQVEK